MVNCKVVDNTKFTEHGSTSDRLQRHNSHLVVFVRFVREEHVAEGGMPVLTISRLGAGISILGCLHRGSEAQHQEERKPYDSARRAALQICRIMRCKRPHLL